MAKQVKELQNNSSQFFDASNIPARGYINPLHKWRLHLNNNTLYIISLVLRFPDKGFFT